LKIRLAPQPTYALGRLPVGIPVPPEGAQRERCAAETANHETQGRKWPWLANRKPQVGVG